MRSNDCSVKNFASILSEVEKVTEYNKLPAKDALRLRLLAEELTGMLPELVDNFDGVFWMKNEGTEYELHVELSVEEMSKEKKEALIEVSAAKKNAAASGFMGKIREIAENMLLCSEEPDISFGAYQYMYDYSVDYSYTYAWTLDKYSSQVRGNSEDGAEEEWDRLEKSIVAKLADDVIVGVRGKKVDIIIKKGF